MCPEIWETPKMTWQKTACAVQVPFLGMINLNYFECCVTCEAFLWFYSAGVNHKVQVPAVLALPIAQYCNSLWRPMLSVQLSTHTDVSWCTYTHIYLHIRTHMYTPYTAYTHVFWSVKNWTTCFQQLDLGIGELARTSTAMFHILVLLHPALLVCVS